MVWLKSINITAEVNRGYVQAQKSNYRVCLVDSLVIIVVIFW